MQAIPIRRVRRVSAAVSITALSLFLALIAFVPASHASTGRSHHAHAASAIPRMRGLTPRIYALMMAQVPLDKAATQIQNAAAKPGAGHGGFFQTHVNDATRTLTVLWHGPVPADITRLIHRLHGHVRIRVVHTTFSPARLNHAVRQALRIDPAVVGAYPLTSGGGVHVDVHASGTPAAAQAQARATALELAPRLGVPVTATPSGNDVMQSMQATCTWWPADTTGPGSRCWDLPPGFWGGDVIQTAYGACTGGFGVHDAWGNTYMLTAAHCAETSPNVYQNGVNFWNGNYTAYMGQITDVPGNLDAAIIPASTGNQYYDGPGIKAGDSTWTKYVVGQLGVSVGDWLCESGSFGGVICAMVVQALGYAPSNTPWDSMALANTTTGVYSIKGDSGGPWFSLAGSDSVYAMGIHHGITTTLQSNPDGGGTGTPTGEVFTPISIISDGMGVWVNT